MPLPGHKMGRSIARPVMVLLSGLCKEVRPTTSTSLSRPSTFLLAGDFLSLVANHVIIDILQCECCNRWSLPVCPILQGRINVFKISSLLPPVPLLADQSVCMFTR